RRLRFTGPERLPRFRRGCVRGTPAESAATGGGRHPSDPRPGAAAVVRPEEAGLGALRVDQREDGRAFAGIDRQAGTSDVAGGQAARQPRPGFPGVRRLVDAAFRPAADHLANGAAALIRRGVDDVGALRIEDDVADAGVGADRQDRRPGVAPVGRLVEAALAARREQRALGRDVDDVGLPRIDQNLPDVFRGFEPDALPRLAGVGRLVDAVSEMGAALAGFFTGAGPNEL